MLLNPKIVIPLVTGTFPSRLYPIDVTTPTLFKEAAEGVGGRP